MRHPAPIRFSNYVAPMVLAALLVAPAMARQPNVLLIVCDDLNTHVSTSGYPHIKTPAFDKIAEAGMRFDRAYCQYPVCNPSRASFLSGLYPQSTGVLDNKSDIRTTRPGTTMLPRAFQQAGYWTGSVGKIYHNESVEPGDAAWDSYLRFENDPLPAHRTGPGMPQSRGGKKPGYGPSGLRDEQHKDGKNVRQVVSWLESDIAGDRPFFIACGIQKPHVPFLAPDAYFAMYPREDLVFAPAPADFWKQAPKSAMVRRFKAFGFELDEENDALRRAYTQAYHACISFIDAQIGILFDALERTGHWEDTIVILTSDHGYQLGEHSMWGKVTLFEDCARVPLIVRVPGMTTPGAISEGLAELVDLYPTLAELCDVPAPADLQGRSLVPALRNPAAPGKNAAYTVVTRGEHLGQAIRTERWRYARWPDGEELYDLDNDPAEHKNLAGFDEFADEVAAMRGHLSQIDSTARAPTD